MHHNCLDSGGRLKLPSAFLEKREIFQSLRSGAPAGQLRNVLDECLSAVETMIDNHQKDEENRYHSR
jgi:hypothetical protein